MPSDQVCGTDTVLRSRLENLLVADQESCSILDTPLGEKSLEPTKGPSPEMPEIPGHLVLRKIGARKINLPPALIQKAEADRLSLSPRLRGTKLDEWIDEWIVNNLDFKQRLSQGEYLASRFRKGKLALGAGIISELFKVKNKVFPNQLALDEWLNDQNFDEGTREKISQAVPPTQQVA